MTEDGYLESIFAFRRWMDGSTPSRVWQRASFATWAGDGKARRWMAKHLQIDLSHPAAWFALAGFAPMQLEERWFIAAPTEAPDPFDQDSFPGEDVVIVDSTTGKASLLGAGCPELVIPEPQPEEVYVHTDGLKWLRAWADDRVMFLTRRAISKEQSRIVPTFTGQPPAALAIGDLNKLPWHRLRARIVRTDFENAKAIKRAIFRAARLPSVEAA